MGILAIGLLVVPFMYMVAQLIDRFQLHGDTEDSEPGALMALGTVFGIMLAIPTGIYIWATGHSFGGVENFFMLALNEIFYVVSIYIYMVLIKTRDMSKVLPWFQTIPAFGIVFAFVVLKEQLPILKILAISLLVIGGLVLSLQKKGLDMKMIVFMFISSGLMAVYDVGFANFGREIDFISALFVNIVGKAFWCSLFLIGKQERKGFIMGLRTRFRLQAVGEITTIAGDLCSCGFILIMPVALVQGFNCLTPLFVLVGAIICGRLFPKVFEKETRKSSLLQRVIGIVLMVLGGIILSS
jgi:uncharacterized membrane protein